MGVLDILKPILFLGFQGIPATRVLQSVASGALGRSSYLGGLPTAALGLALHFFIAFTVFSVYYAASRWLPALTTHALIWGALYGIAVHLFMQFVVFPLSAIGPVPHRLPGMIDGILTHIVCVGLPAALVTREATRRAIPTADWVH